MLYAFSTARYYFIHTAHYHSNSNEGRGFLRGHKLPCGQRVHQDASNEDQQRQAAQQDRLRAQPHPRQDERHRAHLPGRQERQVATHAHTPLSP